jgi:hypothetical protein
MNTGAHILSWGLLAALAPASSAQEKPLERKFVVDTASSYGIQLIVRSEIHGLQAETIGAKAYVKPFARVAEAGLRWTATRRVVAIRPDGSAEIEEALSDFQDVLGPAAATDDAVAKLTGALRAALEPWKGAHTLSYREMRSGKLLELKAEGVANLGEAPPHVLTLWLLHTLRPAAPLPSVPLRFGEPWQEPHNVDVPPWSGVSASENGEWLQAPLGTEPAVRLHLVQQISGVVASGPEKPPEGEGQARFHGESLNTVSLLDGHLLAATSSATREITWTLSPVQGLPEPPQFRARLSVEVQIEACDETPCSTSDRSHFSLRRR